MRKNVAIVVDPFSSGAQYAKRLRDYGVEAVAVISSQELHQSYWRTFTAEDFIEIYEWDPTSPNETFLSRYQPFVVLAGSEPGVELADRISAFYKTPANNPGDLRRDKFSMVEALQRAGLRTIKSSKCASFVEAEEWVREHGVKRFVVKPCKSAGSDGVHVCQTTEELRSSCETILGKSNVTGTKNTHVIVQEFVDGTEYVVDAVSKQGKHFVTAIWQYTKTVLNDGSVVYDTLELLERRGKVQNKLVDYLFSALDALGYQNGPSHNELFVDSMGPVLIESGARPTWGFWRSVHKQSMYRL